MMETSLLLDRADKQEVEYDFYSIYYGIGEDPAADRAALEEELGATGQQLFEEALQNAGMSEDDFKAVLREDLMLTALDEAINEAVAVSEEEVIAEYEQAKSDRSSDYGPLLSVSHILIKTTSDTYDDEGNLVEMSATDIEQARELAEDLYWRLTVQGDDFATVAKAYSADKGSASDGGSLGEYTENSLRGQMVASFGDAVSELVYAGQISPIVESEYGYHIIRLDDIQEQALADVQAKIESGLRSERASEKRRELLQTVSIRPADYSDMMQYGW